jgi:glutathione peroxidase
MSLFDIPVITLDGAQQTLESFRGKVLLIVNVASKCSFTPQYAGLEELHRKYADRGLVILGFPCNQFLSQEPGTSDDIKQFCSLKYDVTFPVFAKIDVNGGDTHPLYRELKAAAPGTLGTRGIKWNFTKFLVGRDGRVMKRYSFFATPKSLAADIEKLLEHSA